MRNVTYDVYSGLSPSMASLKQCHDLDMSAFPRQLPNEQLVSKQCRNSADFQSLESTTRIYLVDDEVEEIIAFDPLTGAKKENLETVTIYANSLYVS